MEQSELFAQLIKETRDLVKQSAQSNRGMVTISPEVAALLEAVQARPTPLEVPATPAPEVPRTPEPPRRTEPLPPELAAIEQEVRQCTKCGLCTTRTNVVFGVGNPRAELVFVGEAPGVEEDRQGEPFVGRAGQLLTTIIVKAMKMRREDVYICNVLKCRPPENRDPNPEEIYHCEPHLLRQLEVIKPKIICALGRVAAQTLLKTAESTGRLRGKWHNYHGIPLRVTYHPAYLLRNPADKRKCWEDIQEIMKVLRGEAAPDMSGGLITQSLF